jgi:hypothetical protein
LFGIIIIIIIIIVVVVVAAAAAVWVICYILHCWQVWQSKPVCKETQG